LAKQPINGDHAGEGAAPRRAQMPLWVQALRAVAWPVFAIFFVMLFHEPIYRAIDPPKSGQQEFSIAKIVEYKRIESAASAGIAVGVALASEAAQTPPDGDRRSEVLNRATEAASKIASSAGASSRSSQSPQQNINGRKILWADEKPDSNIALLNAFQSLGIRVFQTKSFGQAEEMLRQQKFDLVITNMHQGDALEGGLELVHFIQDNHYKTPIIVYAWTWGGQHKEMEEQYGVEKITNDPSEVYSTSLKLLP
jgi:hypothetical protein